MSSDKLDKKVIKEGNKTDYPKRGDQVAMNYTGWLYDANATTNQYRGNQQVYLTLLDVLEAETEYRFDSSEGRGDFLTQIGTGRVIQGTLNTKSYHNSN